MLPSCMAAAEKKKPNPYCVVKLDRKGGRSMIMTILGMVAIRDSCTGFASFMGESGA